MNNARIIRRARAALACALVGFVAVQLALNVVLEGPGAALYDTEFGEKLDRLRKCREEDRVGPLDRFLDFCRVDPMPRNVAHIVQIPIEALKGTQHSHSIYNLCIYSKALQEPIRDERRTCLR